MASVRVKIPGPAASTSKMSKKGWKCWALRVTGVTGDKARPWAGDRLDVMGTATVETGDLILHVDDSSNCGVGVAVPGGEIVWMETAGSAAGLTAAGKRLLALSPADRIAEALRPEGESAAETPAVDLSAVSTDALIRELARRGVTAQ